ncbi:hypothetical protein ACWDNI_32065 [Nocardia niigatensis]
MGLADITHMAVTAALAEFDNVGRVEFLQMHGFGPASRYFLEVDGRRYDSKTIVGVVHGYLPGRRALKPSDFSGGEGAAVRTLRSLGFRVIDTTEGLRGSSMSMAEHDEPPQYAKGGRLQPINDDGRLLNATFWVESIGTGFDLILESAGGLVAGDDRPRNSDYVAALTLLLSRLRDMNATLNSAVVDSARLANLPESERSLILEPLELSTIGDIERVRLALTRPQGRIGLPDGATREGNNRKRIRLRVTVPGYTTVDLDRFTNDLIAACGSSSADRYTGELAQRVEVEVRSEQARLRRLLAGGADVGQCGLCGQTYPLELLVAAHIKRRSACSEDERRDLNNVAMLACNLGCDILYELGWITVGETGHVQVVASGPMTPPLVERLAQLDGRHANAHGPKSEPYFAWHRRSVFRPPTPQGGDA